MREIEKDLWKIKCDLRVVTINLSVRQDGLLVMGRGVAREAAERFPGIAEMLGNQIRAIDRVYGADPMTVIHPLLYPDLDADFPKGIAAFVVKPTRHGEHMGWECGGSRKEPLCRLLVMKRICMAVPTLIGLVDRLGASKVLLPRLGCGWGGLSWEHVRPFLADTLDSRFVVCDYPQHDPRKPK